MIYSDGMPGLRYICSSSPGEDDCLSGLSILNYCYLEATCNVIDSGVERDGDLVIPTDTEDDERKKGKNRFPSFSSFFSKIIKQEQKYNRENIEKYYPFSKS